MKIAVAAYNNKTAVQLSKSNEFYIFDIYDREIKNKNIEKSPEKGYPALEDFLKSHNIEVVISGCMAHEELENLKLQGIKPLTGAEGDPERVVEDYICWSSKLDENVCVQ